MQDNDTYKTSDFGLATFLFYNGLKYTTDKSEPSRTVFIFQELTKARELSVKWFAARSVLWEEIKNG